ncbi:autophagy-related protein 13b-like [Phalaenopsis equestris]|uniref:autophagy-related protein 13b-like n=1 Tax=Phalaenopsis equestris TaxID=78828 RepID=UPI0009E53B6D|nr:autophagy-related protein 13b-like [Phalaenopsis equestris]
MPLFVFPGSQPSNSTSEPGIMEKFIAEFFAKFVNVILQSRSPDVSAQHDNAETFFSSRSSSPPLNIGPRDEWFNLALKGCPAALDNIDMWMQNYLEPLVLDIVLDSGKTDRDESCAYLGGVFVRNLSTGRGEYGRRSKSEKIVERWIVQYERQRIKQPGMEIMYQKAYRRIIVLLRSLYTMVRLLPAYKLFRDLQAPRQMHSLILSHRISSIAEPFSREEDAEMSQHDFGLLDIFIGKLSVSVAYLKTLEVVSSGPSTPISIEFIMDYVASPLVSPFMRLSSLSTVGSTTSYASSCRRHSWSNDHGETPSYSPTPSPTYDFQALHHNVSPCISSGHLLSENSASPCSINHVSFSCHARNFEDCRPSPSFSPSSSSHSIEFKMDYVGSPLVSPFMRLSSLHTVGSATSYASFCNDHVETYFYSPTPSPTYDFLALHHNLSPRVPSGHPLLENSASPCSISHVSFSGHASNFEDCRPSPSFSPSSSSQSCPTHLNRVFLHSESARVSIQLPRQEGSDAGQNQGLSPSPYIKTKRQARASQLDTLGTQENTLCASKTYSPGNKLPLNKESLRLMMFQTEMALSKIVSTGEEFTGYLSGLKSSCSPPRMSCRSSNRLFFMDSFDNSVFSCPFAEDNGTIISYRVESANSKDRVAENLCPMELMPIRRSADAAVVEIVQMLRSARPLQLNNYNKLRTMQLFEDKVSSQTQLGKIDNNKERDLNKADGNLCLDNTDSDLFIFRTVADAFKELQTYQNIRELILKHGGSHIRDVQHFAKSDLRDSSKVE